MNDLSFRPMEHFPYNGDFDPHCQPIAKRGFKGVSEAIPPPVQNKKKKEEKCDVSGKVDEPGSGLVDVEDEDLAIPLPEDQRNALLGECWNWNEEIKMDSFMSEQKECEMTQIDGDSFLTKDMYENVNVQANVPQEDPEETAEEEDVNNGPSEKNLQNRGSLGDNRKEDENK
jgi:hypothetical protein